VNKKCNLADLHIHSIYSDGTDDVLSLIEKINKKGILFFSVTDHDTVDFYKNIDYRKLGNVKLIPGIEFSCITDVGKCHILGYGIDVNNVVLKNTLNQIQTRRKRKLDKRLSYLKENHNIIFDNSVVFSLQNTSSVGKPHIARQLVNLKKSENISDAIEKYLMNIPGDDDDNISPKEAISTILSAGGIPIWAHPLGEEGRKSLDKDKFDNQLRILLNAGIKGVEYYYSRYSEEDLSFIKSGLLRNGCFDLMYLSGGSDYHGDVKNIQLGSLSADNKHIPCELLTVLQNL